MAAANGRNGRTPSSRHIKTSRTLQKALCRRGSMVDCSHSIWPSATRRAQRSPASSRWPGAVHRGLASQPGLAHQYFRQFNPTSERDGDDLTTRSAPEILWSYTAHLWRSGKLNYCEAQCSQLGKVAVPTLIFMGTRDQSVKLQSAVYALTTSLERQGTDLADELGHCLWVDSEKERVWQKAHEFIAACSIGSSANNANSANSNPFVLFAQIRG